MTPNSGAPIVGWLLISLVTVILHLHSTDAAGRTRVNLLNPYFIKFNSVNCNGFAKESTCNLSVSTRAATYDITNIPLGSSIGGAYVNRADDWRAPKSISAQDIIQISMDDGRTQSIAEKARAVFDEIKSRNIYDELTSHMIYDSCDLQFMVKDANVCINDGDMFTISRTNLTEIRPNTTSFPSYIRKGSMFDNQGLAEDKAYMAPFSSGYHLKRDNEHVVFLFDVTGRLLTCVFQSIDQMSTAQWGFHNINAILPSNYANDTKFNDLFRANKKLFESVNKDKDVALPLAHLRTITGNHMFYGNGTSKVVEWCYGSAMFNRATVIKCSVGGKTVENRLDYTNTGNFPVYNVTLHASYVGQLDGIKYEHYLMRAWSIQNDQNLYAYCKTKIGAASSVKAGLAGCEMKRNFSNVPADIIGYADGVCNVTVAIFPYYYQVFTGDSPIMNMPNSQMKLGLRDVPNSLVALTGIHWRTAAVTVFDKDAYFFTYVSTVIKVPISIERDPKDASCTSMKMFSFDFGRMSEMNSLTSFLLPKVARVQNQEVVPMYDYQELAENSNDTQPASTPVRLPLITDDIIDGNTNANPSSTTGSTSTMVIIIAVGLILGGLILVGIIYLFCLRADPEMEPDIPRNSKQSGSGLHSQGSKLTPMATVRSHLNGSKMGSKISSPGSKAKHSQIGPKHPEAHSLARKTAGSRRSRSPGARPLRSSPGQQKSNIHSKSKKLKSHASGTGAKSDSASSKNSSDKSRGSQVSSSRSSPVNKALPKTPRSPASSPIKSPASPTSKGTTPFNQTQSRVISLKTAPSVAVPTTKK